MQLTCAIFTLQTLRWTAGTSCGSSPSRCWVCSPAPCRGWRRRRCCTTGYVPADAAACHRKLARRSSAACSVGRHCHELQRQAALPAVSRSSIISDCSAQQWRCLLCDRPHASQTVQVQAIVQLLRSARSRDSDAAARLLALLHRRCGSMLSAEARIAALQHCGKGNKVIKPWALRLGTVCLQKSTNLAPGAYVF